MGFFFIEEEQKINKSDALFRLAKEHTCLVCPLLKIQQDHPNMKPSGSNTPLIYVLGEYSEAVESKMGHHFIGQSGQLLRTELTNIFGSDYEKLIRFSNSIRCWPGSENTTPQALELTCCKPGIVKDIEETKPLIILGAGNAPMEQILGISGIAVNRGRKFPVKVGKHDCWYFPIFHPSFILRNKYKSGENEYDKVFRQDLQNIYCFLSNSEYQLPNIETDYYAGIEILKQNVESSVDSFIYENNVISLDIETTGLSPYKGDVLLSVAISNGTRTLAFSLTKENILILNKILKHSCTKIIHNIKFEAEWFANYFGNGVLYHTNYDDTMAMAYTLDCRQGGLSLDYLIKLYFGFDLKALSNVDRGNLINENTDKVLLYNALDAKYTALLYYKLKPQLNLIQYEFYRNLVDTGVSLALIQKDGLYYSAENMRKFASDFSSHFTKMKEILMDSPEIKKYQEIYGTFNPNSNPHIGRLLTTICKIKLDVHKDSGSYITNQDALLLLANKGNSVCSKLLDYKEINTLMTKVIKSIPKLVDSDGKLRTNFNHCFTNTSRLSSHSPNVQNFSRKKNKHVRNIIVAPKGHKFAAIDFSALEYRVIAMQSKDPKVCDAIINGYDPHKEWALQLLRLYPQYAGISNIREIENDKIKIKQVRDEVKNLFVFPVIYGAQPYSIAKYLTIPIEIAEELYKQFFKYHVGIKEYLAKLTQFYNKYGYVESLFGFRRYAPISRNELYNTPTQSDAAQIVIRAMNRLTRYAIENNKLKYKPILNIHDDLSFYLPEETLDDDVEFIAKEMVKSCFDFMNVPLGVEVSIGDMWGDTKGYKKFESTDFKY